MDIFERVGSAFVPAFGARVLLGIGSGYSQYPADIKAFVDSEAVSGTWSLSLLLCMWYGGSLSGTEAESLARLTQTTGAARIVSMLTMFREQLTPFVQAAYNAQDPSDLAAAGVYFRAAVERIGAKTIGAAVKAAAVSEVRSRITQEIPLPTDLRGLFSAAQADGVVPESYRETIRTKGAVGRPLGSAAGAPIRDATKPRAGRAVASAVGRVHRNSAGAGENTKEAPPARVSNPPLESTVQPERPLSRAERFERADLTVTPRRLPQLDSSERLLAHLHTQGWSPEDVERLRKGPKG